VHEKQGGDTARQLTPADQRDIPDQMPSCSAVKLEGMLAGRPVLGLWLGMGQLVVSNCFHLHHFSFLGFISPFSFSLQFIIIIVIIFIVILFYFNY